MSYFFDASQGAHEQITGLFDFVWPTAVAMWNLRWQVSGYIQVRPDADIKTLEGRFAEGSHVRGANLKRSCLEHTWEQQQEAFAQVLLVNVFAVYEGWVAEVLSDLNAATKANESGLQFPSRRATPAIPAVPATATSPAIAAKPAKPANAGAIGIVSSLTTNESNTLKRSCYTTLKGSSRYDYAKLDNQLRCYRYFKELRNALIHASGTASQQTVDAYDDFRLVATTADLGISEVPQHTQVAIGVKPNLSLRGVVGFSGMILRMITTIDAELSRSESAEVAFVRRWKKSQALIPTLPQDESKRHGRVSKLVVKAGFPKPLGIATLADFLKAKNLIWF